MKRTPAPAKRRWASLATAAAYYDCAPDTLRRYIAAGDLPGYYVGNRKTLKVDLNDLDALAKRIPSARRSA